MSHPSANRVLKYWLEAIQLEEALSARPRRRPPRKYRPEQVELLEPRRGLSYLRLPLAQHKYLLRQQKQWMHPLQATDWGFFEHWLARKYQAQYAESRGDSSPETLWLIGFPVFYFPRSEELAALFRFPVQLDFLREKKLFKAPSYVERKQKKLPALPTHLRLQAASFDKDELPYTIDSYLAQRVLGLDDQELARFTSPNELAEPSAFLSRLVSLLRESDNNPMLQGEAGLKALTEVCQEAAEGEAQVYPVSLLYDGGLGAATHHLQKEIKGLLKNKKKPPLVTKYLGKEQIVPGRSSLRAGFRPSGLSASQRFAAETLLGSELSVIEGPPGTGKTELILHLAAHHLVERMAALVERGTMPEEILAVCSTNNRAVDNVFEPLWPSGSGLGVALRAGSREQTSEVTLELLKDTLKYLKETKVDNLSEVFGQAKQSFGQLYQESRALGVPASAWVEYQRLARLNQAQGGQQDLGLDGPYLPEPEAIEGLSDSLESLSALEEGGLLSKQALDKKLRALRKKHLDTWQDLLKFRPEIVQFSLEAKLIKDPDRLGELLAQLAEFKAQSRVQGKERKQAKQKQAIREAFQGLDPVKEPSAGTLSQLGETLHLLYEQALQLRRLWALYYKESLVGPLEVVINYLEEQPSLRRALASKAQLGLRLRQLFPVWCSTLLSMGNVFDEDQQTIQQTVLDEAGQCHPAYALSALLRSEQLSWVGDIYQLPPVIRLSSADEARISKKAGVENMEDSFRLLDSLGNSSQSLAGKNMVFQPRLLDHYRCHPEIISVCDQWVGYGLKTHPPRQRETRLSLSPLSFVEVVGPAQRVRSSYHHQEEARAVLQIVKQLFYQGVGAAQLAILTPYVGQLDLLRNLLRRGVEDADSLSLGTVHRFQGGERPVVIFSSVARSAAQMRFLDQRVYLLNVAVSRAKEHFILLGDPDILAAGKYTSGLLSRSQQLGLNFGPA